jgi:ABC-2 type transport system permease protein
MPWDDVAFFGAVITVMTFALNGLAIGLGVLFPNLKETNPNKIVSGFGGTLCFVLSSVYIIAALALLVLGNGGLHGNPSWAVACIIAFIALSFFVGWVPMKIADRQLMNFEA